MMVYYGPVVFSHASIERVSGELDLSRGVIYQADIRK